MEAAIRAYMEWSALGDLEPSEVEADAEEQSYVLECHQIMVVDLFSTRPFFCASLRLILLFRHVQSIL